MPAGSPVSGADLLREWLAVAGRYGATRAGQRIDPVAGELGWLRYLSKHAARGVAYYQRQGKPDGWEKTGRLWGYGGEWLAGDSMRFDVDRAGSWRLRRLIRSWRVADARAALRRQELHPASDARVQAGRLRAARRRLVSARRMLRCSDPKLSAVRGVFEWVGESIAVELLWLVVGEGHAVVQRAETDATDALAGAGV